MRTLKKVWVSTILAGFIAVLCAALFMGEVPMVSRLSEVTAAADSLSEPVSDENSTWQYINYGTEQNPILLPYAFYMHNKAYDTSSSTQNGYYPQENNYNALNQQIADPVHIPLASEPETGVGGDPNYGPLSPYNSNISIKFGRNDTSVKVTQLLVEGYVGTTKLDLSEAVTNYGTGGQAYSTFAYDISLHEIGENYNGFETGTDMLSDSGDQLLPQERIGTYTFNFSYAYSYPNGVSGTTHYTIQFSVINEDLYTSFAPEVYGADQANSTDYYVYNFNRNTTPTIGFDATKFAPSFRLSKKSSTSLNSSVDYTFSQFIKTQPDTTQITPTKPRDYGNNAIVTGEIQLGGGRKIYTYKRYFPISPTGSAEDINWNDPSTYAVTSDYESVDLEDPQTYIVLDYYAEFNPTDFGDYTFSVKYIIPGTSDYIIANISEAVTSLKTRYLSIFGFVANYYNQGITPKAYSPLANSYTQANAYATNDYATNIYSYFSDDPNSSHIYSGNPNINTARDIPITNQAPIDFEFYGTLDTTSKFWTFDNKDNALNALNTPNSLTGGQQYYSKATFTHDNIYLVKLEYTLNHTLTGDDIPSEAIEGTQYFVFEINNTPPQALIQKIGDDHSAEILNSPYTNQNLRVLLPTYTNTFFAPVSVSGQVYNGFNLASAPSTQTLQKKTETSGVDTIVNINGTDYNYYIRQGNNALDYTYAKDTYGVVDINITYGANKSTYTVRYIIDNSAFNGVALSTVVQNDNPNQPTYVKEEASNAYFGLSSLEGGSVSDMQGLINSAFSLEWSEKPWATQTQNGLSSTVTAYRLPFESFGTSPEALLLSNGSDYMVSNGYQTNTIQPVAYKNSKGNLGVSSENFVSANGVYLFYVEDYAGNNFWYIVMLDKTYAEVVQKNNSDTIYQPSGMPNFVNEETTLIFGTHKAIKITDSASTEYTINGTTHDLLGASGIGRLQNTNFFKDASNFSGVSDSYLAVAIDKVEYMITPKGEGSSDAGGEYPIETLAAGTSYIKIYPTNPGTPVTQFYGENEYKFTVYPSNNKVSTLGRNLTKDYIIEMNLDQAQGQYWAYSGDDIQSNNKYISTKTGTNLSLLKFLFRQHDPGVATHIEEISYSYYPFDHNAAASYPFSATATETRNDVLTGSSPNDPAIIPTANGPGYEYRVYYVDNSDISERVTLPGKYVFTRTYSDSESGYGLDIKVRTYTVYVDRNGIVSSNYSGNIREVGDNISIVLGADTINSYTFKNFFRTTGEIDSSKNPLILSTNKMPVQLKIPAFKYYNSPRISSSYAFSRLDVEIIYRSNDATKAPKETSFNRRSTLYSAQNFSENNIYYSSAGNSGALPSFSEAGVYTVTITDNTGYNDTSGVNQNPTKLVFAFRIVHSKPTASFEVTPNGSSKYTLTESLDGDGRTFATNVKNGEANVSMVWQDPLDPYSAKIAQVNITSSLGSLVETFNLSDISIENFLAERPSGELLGYNGPNGIISSNYLTFFKITRLGTYTFYDTKEGTLYHRYSYTLIFNIEQECIYTIDLRYAKLGEVNHGFGENVSNSYSLQIDRTKPMENISRLLSTDSYLTDSGYYINKDLSYLLPTFANEDQIPGLDESQGQAGRPTIYDYAFGINNSYLMTHEATDALSTFYVRKYNKYDTSEGVNANASLAPDNPHNSSGELNYPQFNPYTYQTDGYVAVKRQGLGFINLNDTMGFAVNGQTFREAIMAAQKYGSDTAASEMSGFYEIIERDLAGNYRTYTIYIGDGGTNADLFELDASDGANPPQPFNNTLSDPTIFRTLNIANYTVKLGWAHLSLENMNTQTTIINNIAITPYDPKNQNGANIKYLSHLNNAFMAISSNSKFRLTLNTAGFGEKEKTINIIVQYTKLAPPEILNISNSPLKHLIFPKKDSSDPNITTYPMSIKIYNMQGALLKSFINGDELNGIADGTPATFDVDVGTYRIVYTDNFTSEPYEYIINPGIEDVDAGSRYIPTHGVRVYENGNWFMGDSVTVNYQPLIFSRITVQINGVDYLTSDSENDANSSINNAYKSFVLSAYPIDDYFMADETIGGSVVYTLKYYDMGNNPVESLSTTITIYNELPSIMLRDRDLSLLLTEDKPAASTITTSKPVRIELPEAPDFVASGKHAYALMLSQQTLAGINIGVPIAINDGYVVTAPGIYTVTLINDYFGNSRQIRFIIRDGDSALYSVVTKVGNYENELSPSPAKLNLTGLVSGSGSRSIIGEIINRLQSGSTGNTSYNDTALRNLLINKLGKANTTVDQYFTLRTNPAEVKLDASKNLEIAEFQFYDSAFNNGMQTPSNSTYITHIYLIYGKNDPILARIIAVTEVPANGNLITDFEYVKGANTVRLTGKHEEILYKDSVSSDSAVTIRWNTSAGSLSNVSWFRAGNIVSLKYAFGTSNSLNFGKMPTNDDGTLNLAGPNLSTQTIKGTGKHIINFADMAGNSHLFSNQSAISKTDFSLVILDKVIFNIDYQDIDGEILVNQPAINFMTFNSAVTLKLDPTFQRYYTDPEIMVLLNGQPVQILKDESTNGYIFEQSGRYQVSITADSTQQSGTPEEKRLKTANYSFTILNKTSARLAYEFNKMTDFRIMQIIKDDADITNAVKRELLGNPNATQAQLDAYDITNWFVSADTGIFTNGRYSVTAAVRYNDLLAEKLYQFEFFISNAIPVITTNPEGGESTKGTIIISYNSAAIYNQIGKAYVKVLTYDSSNKIYNEYRVVEINEINAVNQMSTIEIDRTDTYYVELVSDSGNVLSSVRVTRLEPLNTIAIIVIVISCVAAVVLVIVIIKLRTRMKVR